MLLYICAFMEASKSLSGSTSFLCAWQDTHPPQGLVFSFVSDFLQGSRQLLNWKSDISQILETESFISEEQALKELSNSSPCPKDCELVAPGLNLLSIGSV